MTLSHFAIIMDEFLIVPYICPSIAIFLSNNLTYQICDTLCHFGPARYTKPELIWISKMNFSHFVIIKDEFLVVSNICPSCTLFLCNNLTKFLCIYLAVMC